MWIVAMNKCRWLWKGLQSEQKLGIGSWLSLRREDKESVSGGGVVWHLAHEELKHCWGWGWGWQLRVGLKQHRWWRRDLKIHSGVVRFLYEYFSSGSPSHWCQTVSEGFHNRAWQYCLLKIRNCCIGLLMRAGKVSPGGTLQEKLLTFGGTEQPRDWRAGLCLWELMECLWCTPNAHRTLKMALSALCWVSALHFRTQASPLRDRTYTGEGDKPGFYRRIGVALPCQCGREPQHVGAYPTSACQRSSKCMLIIYSVC